jgi:hypothetical protein
VNSPSFQFTASHNSGNASLNGNGNDFFTLLTTRDTTSFSTNKRDDTSSSHTSKPYFTPYSFNIHNTDDNINDFDDIDDIYDFDDFDDILYFTTFIVYQFF